MSLEPPGPLANGRLSLWKTRWVSFLILLADIIGFTAAWKGAWYLRELLNPLLGPINEQTPYLIVYPLILWIGIANTAAFGLYIHRRRLSSLNRPSVIIRASYHWLLYIVVVAFFFKQLDLGRSVILMAGALGFLWLTLSRSMLRRLKQTAIREGRGTVRCAIVGMGPLFGQVRTALREHPEIGFTLAGVIRHHTDPPDASEDVPVLGSTAELADIIERHQVEEVFLAIAHLEPREQLNLLNIADHPGLSVHVVSNIFEVITEQAKVDEIGTFPVITLRDGHLPAHQAFLKMVLDYTTAAVGVVCWFLFLHWWIALMIKRDSPGPIFFSQQRVGRDGRVFRIYKYRTMRPNAQPYAVAPTEEDDPRVTRFGRWLRKTSLDELPQLLNVLRGEMSMVGPRPEMPFLVQKYDAWERRRLDVKPGVTGLWQVIGRKNLPLHLNMQYDLYYIKNQSFLLDVEILLRTVPAVLKGKGAF